MRCEVPIRSVRAEAYEVPTDRPEADGTIAWNSTTLVLVEIEGGGKVGLGYTYAGGCIVSLIREKLAAEITGKDAMSPQACFGAMQRAVRNLGREGLAATAISAIDTALHDLRSRLLDLPLVFVLGARRNSIPIYGSGGFTTYSDGELEEQLGGWVAGG
jgi:L-alanine-DL-glutamate epimerase-like enolase superfamily enzyme